MTRLLGVTSALLTTVFALLVGGLRLQAQNSAVNAYFGDCAMPCWQNVQPGITMRTEALALLKARGWALRAGCNAAVYEVCYDFVREESDPVAFVYLARDQVRQIALFDNHLVTGDLWLAFGAPDYSTISPQAARAAFLHTAQWFSTGAISARMSVSCPMRFTEILRRPINIILVWERGTAMQGALFATAFDLRRAIHRVCEP